jgi:hypothetical protein
MTMMTRFSGLIIMLFFCAVFTATFAEGTQESNGNSKRELTREEINTSIGRFGEVDEVPEGFEFSAAENRIWLADHLKNIKKPMRLYYEFVKSGTYEEGFTDAVYLDIIKINDDGTKNAVLDFFSADRKQAVSPDNVTNITGNPILGIFMQGDVYEMNRLTEGHWRHFQKMIKIALREVASIETVSFEYYGKKYDGEKISFSPYLKDSHRNDFEKFSGKKYEFIFSDDIPGSLYQIKTTIPDSKDKDNGPLIEEVLTLVDAKQG